MPLPEDLKAQLIRYAQRLGFATAGVAGPRLEDDAVERQRRWLDFDCAGEMAYLLRNPEQRFDARSLLPECQSVIVLAMQYSSRLTTREDAQPLETESQVEDLPTAVQPCIARFAWGDDYHNVISARAKQLASWLTEQVPGQLFKVTVDSRPLAEKAFAQAAGLGWQGRNTLVLNREQGSFFILACLLTSVKLPVDQPQPDGCGSCRRCLDACPVGAITEAGWLRADACISYMNNSRKQPVAENENLHGWLYGCDACQEACPYNKPLLDAGGANDGASPLQLSTRESIARLTPAQVHALSEAEFAGIFAGTVIAKRGLALLKAAARSSVTSGQPKLS